MAAAVGSDAAAWADLHGFVATRRLAVTASPKIEGLERRLRRDAETFAGTYSSDVVLSLIPRMPADRSARNIGEAFGAVAAVEDGFAWLTGLADIAEDVAAALRSGSTSKQRDTRAEAAMRCAEAAAANAASAAAAGLAEHGTDGPADTAAHGFLRLLRACCGLVGTEDGAVALAAGDAAACLVAATADAAPAEGGDARDHGAPPPSVRTAVAALVESLPAAEAGGEGVVGARALEVECRAAGCHPGILGAMLSSGSSSASGAAGRLVTLPALFARDAVDADPMSALVAASSAQLVAGTAAGIAWLRISGLVARLAALAGWPVVDRAALRRPPAEATGLSAAAGSGDTASDDESGPDAAPGAGLEVTEPDPVVGAAAAQALSAIYTRAFRLVVRRGPAAAGAEAEAAALADSGIGAGAVVAAMAAHDGLGSPSDGQVAHAAAVAAAAVGGDVSLLRSLLAARDAAGGGSSPLERALARARDVVFVDGFASRSDVVRRATRLGVSQVLRAASVPPAAEVAGRGALASARWCLGAREVPEHLRGMPEEEAAARDEAAARASRSAGGTGSSGTEPSPASSSSSAVAAAGTGSSGSSGVADGVLSPQAAFWAALGGMGASAQMLKSVKSAVWEDREAALAVCEALAGQPSGWGLAALRGAAGLPELLFTRDDGDEAAANDVRRAVAEAAARCPAMEAELGRTLSTRVRALLGSGSAAAPRAEPVVATEAAI